MILLYTKAALSSTGKAGGRRSSPCRLSPLFIDFDRLIFLVQRGEEIIVRISPEPLYPSKVRFSLGRKLRQLLLIENAPVLLYALYDILPPVHGQHQSLRVIKAYGLHILVLLQNLPQFPEIGRFHGELKNWATFL